MAALSAAAAPFFLVLFLLPVSAAAEVSAAGGVEASAAFLLFFDFLPDSAGVAVSAALDSEASAAFLPFFDFFAIVEEVSPAAAVSSAEALSFFAFFLDFLVVSAVDASLEPACAFAKAGAIASVSITQRASIQSVSLCLKLFMVSFPRKVRGMSPVCTDQ